MNINEFEDLMDRCKITMNADGNVCFTPFSDKDTQRINQIIQNNRLENISQQDFSKIPGTPIAYWVSDKMRNVFENKKKT